MHINHIFIDLDGVLADFVGGCEEVFGEDFSELNKFYINDYLGITSEAFWKRIEEKPNFWLELKPYPWARDLVNYCMEKTKGNVTISTSPSRDPKCFLQKYAWVRDKFPGLKRKLMIGSEKFLLAKKERLLIDDSDKNCRLFSIEKGNSYVFPQLWNSRRKKPVWSEIEKDLDLIFVK